MKHLRRINENISSFEEFDLEEIKNLLNILKDDGVPFECKLAHRDNHFTLASANHFHKDIYKSIFPEETNSCKIPFIYVMIYPYKGIDKKIPLPEHINIIKERFESMSEFINRVNEIYIFHTPTKEGLLSLEGRPVYKIAIVSKK